MKYLAARLAVVPLVLALVACQSPSGEVDAPSSPVVAEKAMTKSPNDTRDYRHLELDNGLQVVLISDPKADKAAASLSVFRGSFDDPLDRPGLAHFLEHMLFIGTEKYPEPDGYFKHVKSHGGSSNAYTAIDHTNYFFDIQPEAFKEGFDRFAQFFISPLFDKDYVDREKNAVHSEYQLQIKDDGWRGFAVEKVATNPDHPISQFNIGTLDTLSGDVHSALLEFFEENYSANQMGLVVLSNEPLDSLQPWVVEIVSQIENRNLPDRSSSTPIVAPGQVPATLYHDNIKDQHLLSYAFAMPGMADYYKAKPVQYLSNLIGHEGEGSLHKFLTAKGWIKSLAAGQAEIDEANSALNINIELTPEGAGHVAEISAYLFAYLDLLRESGAQRWIYEEQAMVAELAFRFSEKSSAIKAVSGLSPSLAHYPAEELLIAPYLMEDFDARLVARFLKYLNRDNVLVAVSSQGYQGSETEKWFGVSYDLAPGPIEIANVTTDALALPDANPFLPESLELVAADDLPPRLVLEKDIGEVYLDTDLEFKVPRAVTHLSLRNPGGLMSLDDVAHAQLYATLVQDDLNALAYPALLAGVSYQIAAPPRGFRVSIGGYQDKQLVLLEEVVTRLVGLEIDPERFTVLKNTLLIDLANARQEKPFLQSYSRLQDRMLSSRWTPDEVSGVLQGITVESLTAWRDQVLDGVSVQALVHGNVTGERVTDLMALLENNLSLKAVSQAEPVVRAVQGESLVPLGIEHDDAAMVLYVQDDSDSFEARARSALLTHLISPGYFASLRTDQQLGYAVFTVNTQLRRRGGISFVIQSPVAGPDVLRERTLEFMNLEVSRLEQMSEEEFGANKGGLIATLTQRDKNLAQRASRYWSDLDQGITTFDSKMQLARAVSKLTIEDMSAFLKEVNRKLQEDYVFVFSEGRFGAETVQR